MKSIKHQLISAAILLVIIPVVITNLVYSYYFSNNIKSYIIDNNKRLSSTIADGVSNFMYKAYTLTEEMSQNKITIAFNPQDQKQMLARGVSNNSYFDLLYIQNISGNQTARSSGNLGNRANRWWFKKIMDAKKPFVSKSYYSVNTNGPVTSVFHPILNSNSNIIGVFGGDIKLDSLQQLVEKHTNGKNNYAFIIDSEGVVIAHPNKTQVSNLYNYKNLTKTVLVKDSSGNIVNDELGNPKTKIENINIPHKLKEISEKALNGESGVAEYTDNNNKEIISFYSAIKLPGESQNWAVITVQDKASALAVIKNTQIKNICIALALVLFISILIYFLAGTFTKPIYNLMNLMKKASEGNLTVQSSYISKNEIGNLSESFNMMIVKIRELIFNINEASALVTDSSNSLVTTTDETSKSIEEVCNNISEVASSAENQALNAAAGLETTTKLSDEVSMMTSYMNDGKNSANKVHLISNKGIEVIDTLESVTTENNEAIDNVAEVINSLNEKASTIGNIADTITSISQQTNLLALNAAIEAARAGESGRGFSVVADEVRKLSESTAESSNNVKEMTFNIQMDIKTAMDTIQQAEVAATKQNDAVKYTKDTFNEILSNIRDVMDKITTTSSGLDNIILSKDDLLSVMDKVSKVSTNLAASSEQVSAITEEQTSAIEEINTLTEELSKMAQKLEGSIKTFKLD